MRRNVQLLIAHRELKMFKHVVMWQFKDEADGQTKEQNLKALKEKLMALKPLINEILSISCGSDVLKTDASYDFALVADFDSADDFLIYRDHAEHKKVGEFVKTVTSARVCVDFEY